MADRRQKPDLSRTHASKPSLDTNASGLAESAISYSAFPEPPSSIPTTPIRSVFGESPSPSITSPLFPSPTRYAHPFAAPSSNRFSRSTFGVPEPALRPTLDHGRRDEDSSSPSPSTLSPHDWHEGASSIDVDAAEDRLLPTSFITTLLQENAGPRGANRASYSSDALSGISEMTYPPKQPYTNSLRENSTLPSRVSSHRQSYRGPLPRPVGGRAPSSYAFRQTDQRRNSTIPDSHDPARSTIAQADSRPEHTKVTARSASVLSQSTLVAEPERGGKYGGKLAVHDEVDESDDNTYPADVDTTSSSDFPAHQMGFAQQRPVRGNANIPLVRESVHSGKSVAPSFRSRISSLRSLRRVFTWRRKPLPPVPIIPNISIATEREHRRVEEETPLPTLVNRADRLHGLLEKGYHPHHSISSFPAKIEPLISSFDDAETVAHYHNGNANRPPPPFHLLITWVKMRKMWVMIGIFAFITVVAIGAAVGVTAAGNKAHKSCPADSSGATCSLNATCVCTTSTSDQCGSPIAQAVLDLIPVMNDHLSTNLSRVTVYNSLWTMQGSIQGSSCVEQVNLIDVSFALSAQHQPNRTQWAQIALLWTLTQAQDSSIIGQLHDFIEKAPWTHLDNSDGPVTSTGSDFTTSVAGFDYDFAAQTIVPQSSTFIVQGNPTSEQITRVDPTLRPSLDRIYSYAVASSRQRDKALLEYWTMVLHQREETLDTFKTAFSSSPIILPFNGTSQFVRSLYGISTSFPPPIACNPGLSSDQRDLITAVEQKAFNLSPGTDVPQLNSTCFSQHLTYGVLDLLRTRLPFLDSRNNVPRQGVVLNPNVAPRAILTVGEALSALPGSPNVTRNAGLLADPRSYGTPTFANHVILQYLSAIPTNTANAIINHIVTHSTSIPPPTDPVGEPFLFPLESIPTLEVAVFGDIDDPDADSYLTGFTTSSGSLFFGSDAGNAFRNWAISRGGTIAWTENATSPEVVHDNTFSDNIFNLTWTATSTAIANNVPGVGLFNITESFRQNHRFSP